MELREIDKESYQKKQRKVAIIFCSIFAVFALSISALLRNYYGNPEGENMAVNMAGVLIGLLITILIYSQVYTKPFFDDLRYSWNLKRTALKIQNHRHKWEDLLQSGNQTAATVLAFYHKATLQIQMLEKNEFGYNETVDRENKFLTECEKQGLSADANKFSIDMLEELN
ncbi:MAG: DUF3087 family protein [Neptuniibacter sp.]